MFAWLTRRILLAILGASTAAASAAFAQDHTFDRSRQRSTTPTTDGAATTCGAEGDRRACEAQKKRFLKSQACFQEFRLANGAVRPEAYQHCTEVKQPRGC